MSCVRADITPRARAPRGGAPRGARLAAEGAAQPGAGGLREQFPARALALLRGRIG